jgi:cephalosporin hydroxylase
MDTKDLFHVEFYESGVWSNTYWMGHQINKFATDLVAYQEILFEVKPDLIIECGTHRGGSAIFLGDMCRLIGKGRVVTVDIDAIATPPHPCVEYVRGDSTDHKLAEQINPKGAVLVILDSEHKKWHVSKELDLWGPYISVGSYLIVEDTNLNGHPAVPSYGPGPREALEEWLPRHSEFVIDRSREKYLLTANPGGYLKRV